MQFRHPTKDYSEWAGTDQSWMWALAFGPAYFAAKGARRTARAMTLMMIPITAFDVTHLATAGIWGLMIWCCYAWFAAELIDKSYISRGWRMMAADPPSNVTSLPVRWKNGSDDAAGTGS